MFRAKQGKAGSRPHVLEVTRDKQSWRDDSEENELGSQGLKRG